MPANFPMPRAEPQPPAEVRRTPVTRYLLALSWSPQRCQGGGGGNDALQCDGRSSRFGFVLHGLWPETNGSNWPQWCRPARIVPRATLRRHLCMTPSPQLLQHEWAKHGTCMADDPESYFRTSAILYNALRMPDMSAFAARRDVTVGEVRRAFAAANPLHPAASIAVETNRAGYLDEVRLCLDRRFRAMTCPVVSRGAADGSRLRIAPR